MLWRQPGAKRLLLTPPGRPRSSAPRDAIGTGPAPGVSIPTAGLGLFVRWRGALPAPRFAHPPTPPSRALPPLGTGPRSAPTGREAGEGPAGRGAGLGPIYQLLKDPSRTRRAQGHFSSLLQIGKEKKKNAVSYL